MKIVIGTANFKKPYGYKKFNKKDFLKIKNFIKCKKITYFDIGENYDAYDELKYVINDNSLIIFKFQIKKEKNLIKKIDKIFKIFNLQKIYAILIHDKCNMKNNLFAKNFDILKNLKNNGKIKKLGVSIYDEKELIDIKNIFHPDIIQLPLNIFDQRFLNSNLLNSLKNKGSEVHVRSIFLQGKLLHQNKSDPIILSNKKYFEKFNKFCLKNNLSKFNTCVNFLLQNKKLISHIVIGVSNFVELSNIFNKLKDKEYKHVDFNTLKINKPSKLIDPRQW